MRCAICGAWCRCKNGGRGICCSCHPHKLARGRGVVQVVRRFGGEHFYQEVMPGAEPRDLEETGALDHLERERGIR